MENQEITIFRQSETHGSLCAAKQTFLLGAMPPKCMGREIFSEDLPFEEIFQKK